MGTSYRSKVGRCSKKREMRGNIKWDGEARERRACARKRVLRVGSLGMNVDSGGVTIAWRSTRRV